MIKRAIIFLISMLAICCAEKESIRPGITTDPEDLCQPLPSVDFDYSKIGEHPRLLLGMEDFARIQSAINSDDRLAKIHQHIVSRADYLLAQQPLTYQKEGKRLLNVSRAALERILYMSYLYRMTSQEKYLVKAEATLNEVSDFPDWNQNEHYLDVAEMAFGVAIGLDWLASDLQQTTKDKVKKALKAYAFDTYLADGDIFLRSMSNWNQVCTGGLISAAIACYEDNPQAMEVLIGTLVENNRTHGMTIYNTDGNYSEGYTYWAYGSIYQVITMAALENVFGHDGGLKDASSGFAKTGRWIMFMEGPSGQCFNFSDCNAPVYPRLPLWYISSFYKDASVLYKEISKIDNGMYGKSFEERRFLPLVQVFANASLLNRTIPAPVQKVWFGGETVETHPTLLVHTNISDPSNDYFLAMKGGRASTSHSHMDGGSFVFDAHGMRWAMDLGLQKYNDLELYGIDLWNYGKNSTRWNVFRLNNLSHNVITINGNIYHNEGGAFMDKKYYTERPNGLGGRCTCYAANRYVKPDNDIVNPLTRVAELVSRGAAYDLVVTDELTAAEGKSPHVSWSMATPATAEIISDTCIKLSQGDKDMYLTNSESSGAKLKAFVKDANTGEPWDAVNEGISIVGFEGEMKSGQTWKLTTKLTSILD